MIVALQLFLSLSILIVLHEMGHFLPAKWFKTRVEKFYLFFNPWFSLFKVKKGETEYGIGWLPLGGYVKISGMIDESFDKEQMKGPAQPWEFRSKKAWQRLIIMLGGVTVNFILGFLILGLVAFKWGEDYLPSSEVQYGIAVDSIGEYIGLMDGDEVLSIGGENFDEFNSSSFRKAIVLGGASEYKVKRKGKVVTIPISEEWIGDLSKYSNNQYRLFAPRVKPVLGNLRKDGPAAKAGLEAGDEIISIDGKEVNYFHEIGKQVEQSRGDEIGVRFKRNGEEMNYNLNPVYRVTTGKIAKLFGKKDYNIRNLGVQQKALNETMNYAHRDFNFGAAMGKGVKDGVRLLGDQINAFGKMFQNKIKAKESLGGFISIAKIFPPEWNWKAFWRMTAILSLILGFMNVLPIPALDGGYVMFLLIEMVTGKKFSDKFIERATTFGFILLLVLLVIVNGLDISRLFQ